MGECASTSTRTSPAGNIASPVTAPTMPFPGRRLSTIKAPGTSVTRLASASTTVMLHR